VATNELWMAAAAFAARAHKHQVRKDGQTPYVAHVFRVAMVVRDVFGVPDPEVLAAALLHDTIEDTPTDRDDIEEAFGASVAAWVAALTKDMRLPEREREAAYRATLEAAPWQVQVCKLADIYDNVTDSVRLPDDTRRRTLTRVAEYMDALRAADLPQAREALALTAERHRLVSSGGSPGL
jgi:(p)ppGpp synthase/HD superfamily hydrolase